MSEKFERCEIWAMFLSAGPTGGSPLVLSRTDFERSKRRSKLRCKVQKFTMFKPICKVRIWLAAFELLNFPTNVNCRSSERSLEHFSEKLIEIVDCKTSYITNA